MTTSPSKFKKVSIDFETLSECDLKLCGAYVYAKHLTTIVTRLAYGFDDLPVFVWIPPNPFPQLLIDHIASGGLVTAFNAEFELAIWEYNLRRRINEYCSSTTTDLADSMHDGAVFSDWFAGIVGKGREILKSGSAEGRGR